MSVTYLEPISSDIIGEYVTVRHRVSRAQVTGVLKDVTEERFALSFRIGAGDHEHSQRLSDWERIPKRMPQNGDLIVGDTIRLEFCLNLGLDKPDEPMGALYFDEGWRRVGDNKRADSLIPAQFRLASNAVYLDQFGVAIPHHQVDLSAYYLNQSGVAVNFRDQFEVATDLDA